MIRVWYPRTDEMEREITWTAATLSERLGGDSQLARELVDIFLSEYPKLLQALRAPVVRNDEQGIRRAAHALKGTLANFVETGPTSTVQAIELAATEARLADIPLLLEQLELEIAALASAMGSQTGLS